MAELQTIDELRAAYDGEWALIVDCEFDDDGLLARGRVAAHRPERDELSEEMARYDSGAIRFFGKVPADLYYML